MMLRGKKDAGVWGFMPDRIAKTRLVGGKRVWNPFWQHRGKKALWQGGVHRARTSFGRPGYYYHRTVAKKSG